MSSKSRSVGPAAPSDSTKSLAEKKSVSRSGTSPPGSKPMRSARWAAWSSAASAPASEATAAESFARASASSSLSYTFATCLTCCAKAPYGLDVP
jgi:hypothetical protein